jgi:uridine kinase
MGLGTVERVTERYRKRYLPGQRLYRAQVDPEAIADIVIDNEDPQAPRLVRQPPLTPPDQAA